MSWATQFSLAARAIARNKVRSLLTTLGVVIGVGAVIAMMAIGQGAQARIAEQIEKLGSFTLSVRPGGGSRGGVHSAAGSVTTMTRADAAAIAELPGVIAVSPSVQGKEQVRYAGRNWNTSIEGVLPSLLAVKQWTLAEGEFFSERDDAAAAHVCVIGATVLRELFGLARAIGEVLLIKGLACRIVGIMAERGAGVWGGDQDDVVYMPLSTVQRKILGIAHIQGMELRTSGREVTFRLEQDIEPVLRQRHRLVEGQENDFRVFNRAELAQSAEESGRVFAWLLGSIASVSLLVGGIGIMNIMLVSVSERTREIGIRMALGARQRDILSQFLLEAALLSGVGGVLGVALGVGGAFAMSHFSQFEATVTLSSVLLAFGFAVVVGIFFGLHPAYSASRLKPIDALRYE